MTDDSSDDEGGLPLPTVGNAVVKAVNSGPGKALLNPAFKVFGDYWGWRAKELTENWKKQREQNLETHAARVQEKEGTPIPRQPTEKQVILVNEWIERAQEVDPDDPEIAALWQTLLGAIYRKEAAAKDWLEVIKQLNESDARLLLRISQDFQPTSSREQAQATKFASLGLLESFQWARALGRLEPTFLAVVVFLALVILAFSIPDQMFDKFLFGPAILLIKPVLVALGGMSAAIALMQFARAYLREANRYRISDLGMHIRQSALLYIDKKPPVARKEIKPGHVTNSDELTGSIPESTEKKSERRRPSTEKPEA